MSLSYSRRCCSKPSRGQPKVSQSNPPEQPSAAMHGSTAGMAGSGSGDPGGQLTGTWRDFLGPGYTPAHEPPSYSPEPSYSAPPYQSSPQRSSSPPRYASPLGPTTFFSPQQYMPSPQHFMPSPQPPGTMPSTTQVVDQTDMKYSPGMSFMSHSGVSNVLISSQTRPNTGWTQRPGPRTYPLTLTPILPP